MGEEKNYTKIIAAGVVCLDITPVFSGKKCEKLTDLLLPGRQLLLEGADVHLGGSVSNTGLALKILGNDVTLLGKVGDDEFGAIMRNRFAQYGAGGLIVDPNGASSYSVILAVPGIDRIILHSPGCNDTYENRDIPEEALTDACLFHFGYPPNMRKMYENDGEELKTIFARMKEKGIATSLDLCSVDPNAESGRADWKKILRKVIPYVDFLVPSFEELLFMLDREKYDRLCATGKDICEQIDPEKDGAPLAEELMKMGAKIVLIKCGTAGMYYRTAPEEKLGEIGARLSFDRKVWADQSGTQGIFPVENVKIATGAGDTSIAAFLTGILKGKTPAMCAKLAAAEGACCVTAYDALSGLKSFEELEAMVSRIKPSSPTWTRPVLT